MEGYLWHLKNKTGLRQKNGTPVFFQSREAERFFVLRTALYVPVFLSREAIWIPPRSSQQQ